MIPVPPYACEMVDEAETVPLIDWRMPVKFPTERVEVKRLVVEAVVAKSAVVVALPVTVRLPTMVELAALMMMPEVVALVPAVG